MHEYIAPIKPDTLVVNEIFYSIQGESSYAGKRCVFIRLASCNLRCSYCDTTYAYNEGTEISIADILYKVRNYNCNLVEITGGEPLLQSNVHSLLSQLCIGGYEVLLETGGSLDISSVDARVHRIVDFKCPSSKMVGKNLWDNVQHLKPNDEIKFVIGNREDYEWASSVIQKYGLSERCPIYMSVVFGRLEPKQLVGWILEDKLDVNFQLQIQKYIWEVEKRGV